MVRVGWCRVTVSLEIYLLDPLDRLHMYCYVVKVGTFYNGRMTFALIKEHRGQRFDIITF